MIRKLRKPKRIEGIVGSNNATPQSGWIIARSYSKQRYEGATHKDIVQLDNGQIIEVN